jgi:hypothetical protein
LIQLFSRQAPCIEQGGSQIRVVSILISLVRLGNRNYAISKKAESQNIEKPLKHQASMVLVRRNFGMIAYRIIRTEPLSSVRSGILMT